MNNPLSPASPRYPSGSPEPDVWPVLTGGIIPRPIFVSLLKTALAVGETGFARRAALTWLTAYPGDLPVGLLHAQALLKDRDRAKSAGPGRLKAARMLESLCQLDPEYLEANEWLLRARRDAGLENTREIEGNLASLGAMNSSKTAPPAWSGLIRQARRALAPQKPEGLARVPHLIADPASPVKGRSSPSAHSGESQVLEVAEQLVHRALLEEPLPILAAITHLEVNARRELPAPAMRSLAELYHTRWPNCLQFKLLLAGSLMDGGESDQAVSLLHEAAAQDITGQVAIRLWGKNHPYQALWPGPLEVRLDTPVPAAVAAALGWNQLPSGVTPLAAAFPGVEPCPPASQPIGAGSWPEIKTASVEAGQPAAKQAISKETSASQKPAPAAEILLPTQPQDELSELEREDAIEELQSVKSELTRVASGLKKPQLTRADGRFPIYVIFTTRKGLEKQYGKQDAAVLESSLRRLADAVRLRKDWGALVYFADEGYSCPMKNSGIKIAPAKPEDAWSLKLALADLDSALRKRGEMIGALLIVGGPEIVPFHHLPNPVDDIDLDIPSDNPYATRDENYFIPEWPVGRLPGGCGPSSQPLMDAIVAISAHQRAAAHAQPWLRRLLDRMALWFRAPGSWGKSSLGYSAAVWKRASLTVFRPIGDARDLLISPPMRACSQTTGLSDNGGGACAVLQSARFGYFNLHGLPDAVEWYGQVDPGETQEGPDYPVALRPQDLAYANGHKPPQVVFSEACYGAHILGRTVDEALALKFLSSGSQAVVGSTCTAYGAVTEPLTAADLLGFAFWSHLRDGLPAGEALRRAKVHLARVMHRRQGYLDGEDQKTLISFVLYGDPLAQVTGRRRYSKSVLRPLKSPGPVKAVCDRTDENLEAEPIPPQVMVYVKHIVAQYLPGMADADMSISQEHSGCQGETHQCPTSQMGAKAHPSQAPERKVVTLSKQVERSAFVHHHFARLTLDGQGKLVKLVVSR